MKITHICLVGLFTEGQTYQENLLAKYHVKAGYEVSAIISQWQWNENRQLSRRILAPYTNQDDVRVYPIPNLYGHLDVKLQLYKGLVPLLEQLAPDILFIHGLQFLNMFTIVRYLKKHPNVRVYVDNHADFSNSATNWFSKNILHKIIWRLCAHAIEPYTTKFYGVLPARVDFLTDVYKLPAKKCELLVMGVDDDLVKKSARPEVREQIRKSLHIQPEDFLIVTGGKIDLYKMQTLLLMRAVQNIKNPRVRLVVFGSVVKELKEKMAQLADGVKVQYLGWMPGGKSYDYFAAADLVCFPGRHSVFWEQAAGQGIPLVVKDWLGTHHVDLGGNVKFLTQDNVHEIQRTLEEIIENPDKYKKMKQIAQEKGLKMFSYQDIAKRSLQ